MSYNGTERRKFNWYPLIGYVVLLIAVVGAVYMVQGTAIERERQAQLVQCDRVQLLRDQANGTNFLVHDYFAQAAAAQREAAKVETSPEQRKIRKDTASRLQHTADTTVVTGPTDCGKAVDEPTTYKAPAPSFISEGGSQIEKARQRAMDIIKKAENQDPLYEGTEGLPVNP